MKQGRWILLLILILFSAPVSAEFYKYVDKDGNVLYTDDLSQVPEEQRAGLRVFDESQSGTYSTTGDVEKQEKQMLPGEGETSRQKEAGDFEETRQRLEKQKEALDKESEALEKEREALVKEKEELVSSRRFKSGSDSIVKKKLKELTEKTEKFRKKLNVMKEKRAAHEAEVEAFNAKANEAQKR
ncbi:MAG: DUF4124 domain-containing protein [Desulfobacterales bacterium]|uniref:DUF4124 domain-containing protein n=1 Tax=Candidatus Desulfatibia profunda TaxID=2841695 RepID=A0A8J6TKI7_9BACT|nr:DUF4124 domain-containing protein [Candidatus Desulfatibia profunda]MBL7178926.1 DUF4124 domain-containing protein [Desulfobacterales bacterium]